MPRRRRLKKRQQKSPLGLKRLGGLLTPANVFAGAKTIQEIQRAAKRIKLEHKAAVGRGTRMKKKEPIEVWKDNSVDGIKYHTKTVRYKPTKLQKFHQRLSQPGQIYQYNATGSASLQGLQNTAIVALVDSPAINQLYTGLNNAVAITPVRQANLLNYRGCRQEIQFGNMGNSTAEFEIYFCIDKTTSATLQVPNVVWDTAISQESNDATVPIETRTDPWKKPTEYKAFNIVFWTKSVKCFLTPGEKCNLTYNFWPNRLLDTSYVGNFNSIRGITYQIMIVHRGTMGDATQTKTVTAASQTLTPSKIVWINKRTMFGNILGVLPRVNKQVGAELPTALGTLFTLDEDTGEPEDTLLDLEYA